MSRSREELREQQTEETVRRVRLEESVRESPELGEVETLLDRVESKKPPRQSVERWADFNERLMKRIMESERSRPLSAEWRKQLYDRFRASDSRLKEFVWVIVAIVMIAIFSLIATVASGMPPM